MAASISSTDRSIGGGWLTRSIHCGVRRTRYHHRSPTDRGQRSGRRRIDVQLDRPGAGAADQSGDGKGYTGPLGGVQPDAVDGVEVYDLLTGKVSKTIASYLVEVKAVKGIVDYDSSNYQAAGLLEVASIASVLTRAPGILHYVTTSDTQLGPWLRLWANFFRVALTQSITLRLPADKIMLQQQTLINTELPPTEFAVFKRNVRFEAQNDSRPAWIGPLTPSACPAGNPDPPKIDKK